MIVVGTEFFSSSDLQVMNLILINTFCLHVLHVAYSLLKEERFHVGLIFQ